jgi:hypothetical protein
MVRSKPVWMHAAPWSITLPTDQPLTKEDIQGHEGLLPGHGPSDDALLWGVDGHARLVLPYLIPQSQEMASRLVFAWAFKAPLVKIAEISIAMPRAAIRRVMPAYDPLLHVIIYSEAATYFSLAEFFNIKRIESFVWEGELGLVLPINKKHVAVAPLDTPVHHFSDDLADFPDV